MSKVRKVVVIVMALVLIALGVVTTALTSFNDHTYVATVTDKERIVQNDGEDVNSYYLIFCKDDQGNYYELKNEDSLIRGKFNSSNFYNRIEEGKTYEFTVVGYRIGFFSAYENIIDVKELPDEANS